MLEKTRMLASRAGKLLASATGGYPMQKVEMTMDSSATWLWVYRDRFDRHWLAAGPWSPFRKRAAFDMAGFWTEADETTGLFV